MKDFPPLTYMYTFTVIPRSQATPTSPGLCNTPTVLASGQTPPSLIGHTYCTVPSVKPLLPLYSVKVKLSM